MNTKKFIKMESDYAPETTIFFFRKLKIRRGVITSITAKLTKDSVDINSVGIHLYATKNFDKEDIVVDAKTNDIDTLIFFTEEEALSSLVSEIKNS